MMNAPWKKGKKNWKTALILHGLVVLDAHIGDNQPNRKEVNFGEIFIRKLKWLTAASVHGELYDHRVQALDFIVIGSMFTVFLIFGTYVFMKNERNR